MNSFTKRVRAPGGPAGRRGLLGAAIFFALAVLPLHAQDMSERDLQNMYMSYLREEGYSPWVDEDGDVAFKADSLTYYIFVSPDDLEYFHLLLPAFHSIDTQQERQRAADAISTVNRSKKVAKVYMNTEETNVYSSAQIFVKNPGDFKSSFTRMSSNVLGAARDFLEALED